MLNCRHASQLASRAMDEKLPFWKSLSLKIHLLLCRSCNNFSKQLDFLRKISRHGIDIPDFQLTDEAKHRIAATLSDKQTSD